MRQCHIFLITLFSIIVNYYMGIILHEWGHSVVAWILGYKAHFFDIRYGGWLLLNADENVPYRQILANDDGVSAALIGIAGLSVSLILFLVSLIALQRINHSALFYSLFYWLAVLTMVPIFQYLIIQTFSETGDVGRFTHGLNISPWWVFIPGTIFIGYFLYRFYTLYVPKAYAILSIRNGWMKRCFLLVTLSIMFLLIYTHGYNPFSDEGMPFIGQCLAGISILLVPIIFFLTDPHRRTG